MAGEAQRDWNEGTFNQFRQTIMEHFHCSEEEATNRLQTMIQNLVEEPQGQPIPPLHSPSPIPPRNPPPPQNIPLEKEPQPPAKEDKFPDFDLNASISDRIPHNPSQYATGNIENMEYMELWYFTTEGYKEASKATPTAADDTFGILNTLGTRAQIPTGYMVKTLRLQSTCDSNMPSDQMLSTF